LEQSDRPCLSVSNDDPRYNLLYLILLNTVNAELIEKIKNLVDIHLFLPLPVDSNDIDVNYPPPFCCEFNSEQYPCVFVNGEWVIDWEIQLSCVLISDVSLPIELKNYNPLA